MSLQKNATSDDCLHMNATPSNGTSESSDQDLVDSYTTIVPPSPSTDMTTKQLQQASEAAHALELRGYTEQAGTWMHDERPPLRATA